MKEKIIDKIQKLLALAGNNPCEAEAQAALLKAQALMAQHKISLEEAEAQDGETYALITTKGKPKKEHNGLAVVIASSFACKCIIHNQRLSFFGRTLNAQAAASAFEFAYGVMKAGGRKAVKAAGYDHHEKGSSVTLNSYTRGFVIGLKSALDAQTVALAVVVPEDVKAEFESRFAGGKTYQSKRSTGVDPNAYYSGMTDGKTVMSKRSLGE